MQVLFPDREQVLEDEHEVFERRRQLLGRVRVSEVEEAQYSILQTAQEMEEKEEITLSRSTKESMVE